MKPRPTSFHTRHQRTRIAEKLFSTFILSAFLAVAFGAAGKLSLSVCALLLAIGTGLAGWRLAR